MPLRSTRFSLAAAILLTAAPSALPTLAAEPPTLPAPAERLGVIDSVDALLDALERADVGIQTFQSELIYDRRFRLQGDRHIRFGKLYFQVTPGEQGKRARRTFAVRFRTLTIPDDRDNVRRTDESLWIFDGQWLIEKREAEKQFIKRQIARPDDPIDPLRLGEGPLPIPIGQKKVEILARYNAELLEPDDSLEDPDGALPGDREVLELADLRSFVADAYQIRLTPKPELAGDEEFQEIRLWYTRKGLLPRAARTINRAGDDALVLLAGARVNDPLDPTVMSVQAPDAADGWRVQIDEGRVRGDAEEAR